MNTGKFNRPYVRKTIFLCVLSLTGVISYILLNFPTILQDQSPSFWFLLINATSHHLTAHTLQYNHTEPVSVKNENDLDNHLNWKTVLIWHDWFGYKWDGRFGPTDWNELRKLGCPSWKCRFTYDKNLNPIADAIIFRSGLFTPRTFPKPPRPRHQRWLWVDVEAQTNPISSSACNAIRNNKMSHHINWTMTHHSGSDIVAMYGHFLTPGAKVRPLRPNLMAQHPEALARYKAALERGDTLEQVMGDSWKTYVNRTKVVAWITSHCRTDSKREEYVEELKKYVNVEQYGGCTRRPCGRKIQDGADCWTDILAANYSFYMAMENSLCEGYVTEKLYLPLTFKLVPVVWGGVNYDDYLPPHSYINARHYHPKDLAKLLLKLHHDPVALGRYHVWRGYFEAKLRGSFCELCHRLHTDTEASHHTDIPGWWCSGKHCTGVPPRMFSNTSRTPDAWKKIIDTSKGELV